MSLAVLVPSYLPALQHGDDNCELVYCAPRPRSFRESESMPHIVILRFLGLSGDISRFLRGNSNT